MLAPHDGSARPPHGPAPAATIATSSPSARQRIAQLCELAQRGLNGMAADGRFPHTVRGVAGSGGLVLRPEGDSLRYAAIVALGLGRLDRPAQRAVLHGMTATDLAMQVRTRAADESDAGAVALAAWAAAEVAESFPGLLFARLSALLASGQPIETVTCAWILSAAIAARRLGPVSGLIDTAAARLLVGQTASGLFPHTLPAAAQGRLRAHIGCFADQVYPIQALARLRRIFGDTSALAAAERCASRICAQQGLAGQWWWHYDIRTGAVVEGYPVYSVHQHAMAPMALFELAEAGGKDRLRAVLRGLDWIYDRPESNVRLVHDSAGLIWRKIGRAEPRKAVRSVSAVTSSLGQGWRLPGLDLLFPATSLDCECRPYELGWLLYAWQRDTDPLDALDEEHAHA